MRELHQAEAAIVHWPLHKLYVYAGMAAAMSGKRFPP